MTLNAAGPAEEEKCSILFLLSQSVLLSARKSINWSISEGQRKLKFGDRQTKHIECDRTTISNGGKNLPKAFSVLRYIVDSPQHFVADVEVVARKDKAGDFNPFSWWYEGLCYQ